MSKPNSNLKKEWTNLFKNQIQKFKKDSQPNQQDDSLEVQVLPANPVPIVRQKQKHQSSISIYLDRKRYRNSQNVVNLLEQDKKPTNNALTKPTTNPAPPKATVPIAAHKKQRQERPKDVQVINIEEDVSKQNVQKYKRSIFSSNEGSTFKGIATRNTSIAIQKQIQIIEDLNKPEWIRQKEQRRAVNRQKYPNSFTHSYNSYDFEYSRKNAGFSAMGSDSDKIHQSFLQKRQELKKKKRENKQSQKNEDKEKRKQEKKKKIQQQQAEYESIFAAMAGQQPRKKIKQNTQPIVIPQQTGLRNQSVVQQVNQQQQQQQIHNDPSNEPCYVPLKRQQRYGVRDIIKPSHSAPQLQKAVLRHKYGQNIGESQIKKIPDIFQNDSIYKKAFHYLITNECIADLKHRLKMIEKTTPQPIKITINNSRTNSDGFIQLQLQEKQVDKNGVFTLKNYSLSRHRLGLICSSKQYRSQYYGLPSKNRKQFAFIVQLVTPQTKQDISGQVKALSLILQSQLQLFLANRKSRQVNYFDLQKLTTHVRQYVAVSNMQYSQLKPAILDPRLVQKQLGAFVQYKEVLDNILQHLKQIFNQTQWQSIREMVLRQRGFVLLQGPPGTGKTSTLMGLLSAQYDYLKRIGDTRKIMICAPSNAAVDHIVKRISTEGLFNGEGQIVHPRIIRTGIVDTQDPVVRAVSLDDLCEKTLLANCEQAQKMNNMTTPQIKEKIIAIQKQMRRLTNRNRQNQLAQKKQELVQFESMLYAFRRQKYIYSRRNYSTIQNELLNSADIVLTTLASSGSDKMDKLRGEIACLIVDQAAQATEPNLLIALQTGVEKVLLIGDPYQLPATCISQDSNVTLFNRSLFERMLDANIKPYFLNIQYRMAPNIRAFPSSRFYQSRLLDAPNVIDRPIPQFIKCFSTRNVLFIDVKHSHDQRRGDSYWNQAQTKIVSLLIRCLIHPNVTMGLITPYQAQRRSIVKDCTDALRTNQQDLRLFQKQIMINTVDSFQGQQKDIILVSTVRANHSGQVGFLTDQRRINVTLTRAKYLLIVIGNGDTLGSNEVWNDFLSWTESTKSYYQIYDQKQTDTVISDLFQRENRDKVRRRHHHKLTSDIRKMHRNQIQSKDFRSRKEEDFAPFPQRLETLNTTSYNQNIGGNSFSEKQNPPQDQPNKQFNKYALDIKESQHILEQKRQREKQAKQFEQAMQRMKKFQDQNYSKLKDQGFYDKN